MERRHHQLQVGTLILTVLLFLSACSRTAAPTLDPSTWAPGTGSVSGNVVNRKAGTDLEGVKVTLVGTDVSTTTDAHGFYRLFNIPAGYANLSFSRDGYALSTVEGLRVGNRAETKYDTIVAEAFNPYLPVVSPTIETSLENGASAPGGDEGVLSFSMTVTVADPEHNRANWVTVGLGRAKGIDGTLGASEPGGVLGNVLDGVPDVELPTAGFDGETSVHITVYDLNNNRTEVVRYITINGGATGGTLGTLTNLGVFAVTFGDAGAYYPLSTSATFSGRDLLQAVKTNDTSTLTKMARDVHRGSTLQPQDVLDEAMIWTEVYFSYEGDTLPTAFVIYRHLVGRPTGGLVKVGQLSPAQANLDPEDPDNTIYLYRDATAGLEAGVEARYRIEAVYGDESVTSSDASTTPLPILQVEAKSPRDDETDVSLTPDYEFSVEGRSNLLYSGVVVLDNVHAQGGFEWSRLDLDDSGVTSVSIPHNSDGTAVNETLQPFHAYQWQPIALTSNGTITDEGIIGENAISVAADFFDLFGFGFDSPASDGPVNTFSTSDGSF